MNNALDVTILVDNAIRNGWNFERDSVSPAICAKNKNGSRFMFNGELQLINWLKDIPIWEPTFDLITAPSE